jgi:divalent metal cation (Fe/Co/Zn/Cd) transporter
MKATALGLLVGAGVSWASYEGLITWLPNPLIVTAIVMMLFAAIARLLATMAKREAASKSSSPP